MQKPKAAHWDCLGNVRFTGDQTSFRPKLDKTVILFKEHNFKGVGMHLFGQCGYSFIPMEQLKNYIISKPKTTSMWPGYLYLACRISSGTEREQERNLLRNFFLPILLTGMITPTHSPGYASEFLFLKIYMTTLN